MADALGLVAEAFRPIRRKGTDIPYLSHLMQVAVWVAERGGTEEQILAALLHDYISCLRPPTSRLTDLPSQELV